MLLLKLLLRKEDYMNNSINEKGMDYISEAIKSIDIKITLEQWPCAVAILGGCATYAFVSWINKTSSEINENIA